MAVDSSGLRAALQVWAEDVAAGAARQALDTVRPGVPVKDGNLADSEFDDTSGVSISIGYSAEHAEYTDAGTSAHTIPTPVAFHWESEGIDIVIVPQSSPHMDGRVSRFETEDGTVVIMGKPFVDHPGTPRTGWWSDIIGTEENGYDGLLEIVQAVADITTVQA